MRKIVFQSIDSPRRELEWKLLLAAKLSKSQIHSVIGSKASINSIHRISRNCIFLGRLNSVTGRNDSDKEYIRQMEKNRTSIFFLHDEGAFYFEGEYQDAVRKIYPEEIFANPVCKKVFFWGERQRSVLSDNGSTDKYYVTGHPRFDLCKEWYDNVDDFAMKQASHDYNDFVLVCTRFGAVNRVPDEPGTLSKRSFDIRFEGSNKSLANKDILAAMFGSWKKISYEFSYFVPAIAKLAQDFPEINFLVRPHPAERESFYREAFSHFSNVFVSKSGDVRPLIRAAKAVIHSECTTGIEAEISRKPNINFRPTLGMDEFKQFKVAGVSDVGVMAKDYPELKVSFQKLIDNGFEFEKGSFDISPYLYNAVDKAQASDFIVDELVSFSGSESRESSINKRRLINDFLQGGAKDHLRPYYHKMKSLLDVKKIYSGETKYFRYSNEDVERLWEKFGGSPGCLSIKKDVIYTYPDKQQ